MADVDDWRTHYDLVRASTGRAAPKPGAPRPAGRGAISLPSLSFDKSARYALTALGLLGFFLFPETEHRRAYPRPDVQAQIDSRVGDRLMGSYRLAAADPFPDLALPYDLVVTVDNGDYRAAATVKGEMKIDHALSAIRIITPTEVQPLDVKARGRTVAAAAASYAPGFLKGFAQTVGGLADMQAEIRAQSDAQAAARNFVIHRISDHDRALFESKEVQRIERDAAGLSVIYVDGWSPSAWSPVYWLFLALFVFGALSSMAAWR